MTVLDSHANKLHYFYIGNAGGRHKSIDTGGACNEACGYLAAYNAKDEIFSITGAVASYISECLKTCDLTLTYATNVDVRSYILWSSDYSLTLKSQNDIIFNQSGYIRNTGAGLLKLMSGMENPQGSGTVIFSGSSNISITTSGRVEIYYNPVTESAHKYSNATIFNGHINPLESLTAFMLVNTILDLQDVGHAPQGDYALSQSIDAQETFAWNDGMGFQPIIGSDVDGEQIPFSGIFEGNGYTIKNIYINRTVRENVGLFSLMSGAENQTVSVRNMVLEGCVVVGGQRTGAIAGKAERLFVDNITLKDCQIITANVGGGHVGKCAFCNIRTVRYENTTIATWGDEPEDACVPAVKYAEPEPPLDRCEARRRRITSSILTEFVHPLATNWPQTTDPEQDDDLLERIMCEGGIQIDDQTLAIMRKLRGVDATMSEILLAISHLDVVSMRNLIESKSQGLSERERLELLSGPEAGIVKAFSRSLEHFQTILDSALFSGLTDQDVSAVLSTQNTYGHTILEQTARTSPGHIRALLNSQPFLRLEFQSRVNLLLKQNEHGLSFIESAFTHRSSAFIEEVLDSEAVTSLNDDAILQIFESKNSQNLDLGVSAVAAPETYFMSVLCADILYKLKMPTIHKLFVANKVEGNNLLGMTIFNKQIAKLFVLLNSYGRFHLPQDDILDLFIRRNDGGKNLIEVALSEGPDYISAILNSVLACKQLNSSQQVELLTVQDCKGMPSLISSLGKSTEHMDVIINSCTFFRLSPLEVMQVFEVRDTTEHNFLEIMHAQEAIDHVNTLRSSDLLSSLSNAMQDQILGQLGMNACGSNLDV